MWPNSLGRSRGSLAQLSMAQIVHSSGVVRDFYAINLKDN